METFKSFVLIWTAVVMTVVATFGLCKLGGDLFNMPPARHGTSSSSDAVTGCNEQGGTVVAKNGEYQSCSFRSK